MIKELIQDFKIRMFIKDKIKLIKKETGIKFRYIKSHSLSSFVYLDERYNMRPTISYNPTLLRIGFNNNVDIYLCNLISLTTVFLHNYSFVTNNQQGTLTECLKSLYNVGEKHDDIYLHLAILDYAIKVEESEKFLGVIYLSNMKTLYRESLEKLIYENCDDDGYRAMFNCIKSDIEHYISKL